MSWLDKFKDARTSSHSIIEAFSEERLKLNAFSKEKDYGYSFSGYGEIPFEEIHKLFGKEVFERIDDDGDKCFYFATKDTVLKLYIANKSISGELISNSSLMIDDVKSIFKDIIGKRTPSNNVHVLVAGAGGLSLVSVGEINHPLCKENYTPDIISNFDHLVDCLNNQTPCGRLSILEGPPGTGKSFMIRSIITQVEATFILIGSSLVGSISGPDIFPVIMRQAGNLFDTPSGEEKRPIVIIIEDADAALVKRDHHTNDKISDVLNMGDGLLGELVDMRIIATTNAKQFELDPAICRAGRMCRHLHLDNLNENHAKDIYKRLVNKNPDEKMNFKDISLAEVYRYARQDGWSTDKQYNKNIYVPGDYL